MLLFLLFLININLSIEFNCPNHNSPYLSISLPKTWINGSLNCFDKNVRQRYLDIFSINNDTFILRENKCINYEAPFMYLLFSNYTILLIDSGATVSSRSFPIQRYVETIILSWCSKNKKLRKHMKLIISHTHNHLDHTAGDEQFQNKSFTTIIGTNLDDIRQFFQLNNWPNSIGHYKLDNQRHLAIIPIPGHEKSSIAFYDCATGLLITGDSLYPGRLYISNFTENVESISRLINFIQINHLNITSILGAHIEMTNKNQIDYPIGTTYQPNERQLNMSFKELEQLNHELQYQWKNRFDQRHKVYYDTFIIDPKSSELSLLPVNGRFSNHTFVLLRIDRLNYIYLSYKPMFYTSIDYQFVFLSTITSSTIDLSILLNEFHSHLTIESYELSLNNFINGNYSSFQAKLYIGDKEKYLSDITINPIQSISIIQLNTSDIQPYQPLRYISYLLSNSTKSQIDFYLLHEIRVLPDFDSILHVTINPMNCTSDIQIDKLPKLLEQYGNQWAFHGFDNNISNRLISGQARAQLLGDIYSTICTISIMKEIQFRYLSHYQSNVRHEIKMINHDEEKFFYGFIPIWALTLFTIAILFLIIFIIGLICYLINRHKSREYINNNIHLSVVEQSLLQPINQIQTKSIEFKDSEF